MIDSARFKRCAISASGSSIFNLSRKVALKVLSGYI